MAGKRVSVKIQPKKGTEEAFFAKQDQKKLRELRKSATDEATKKYCKEHLYHCFRCGTKSLAEIDEGKVKIETYPLVVSTFSSSTLKESPAPSTAARDLSS